MKISYITDIDFNEESAAKAHVIEISKNLVNQGNLVELNICSNESNEIIETKNHIKINFFGLKPLIYNGALLIKSLRYLFIKRPDLIYTRQSPTLIAPAIISKIFKIPYITEINGTIEEQLRFQRFPEILIKISNFTESYCYNQSNKIIAASKEIGFSIQKKYELQENKIFSLENGVDTQIFKKRNKKTMRGELGFSNNDYLVGYVGGLLKWQGIDYIINSISKVKEEIRNIRLIIIGEGLEKEYLKKLVVKKGLSKRVSLIGPLKHFEVPKYLNTFDINICYLTKLNEGKYGTPFKMYEYLASGTPVIMSDIKGITPLFKDYVILAKPEDPKDLADKIIKLIKDKKLREKLGKEGRKFVVKNHSWKKVAKKTENIIKQAIKEHNQKSPPKNKSR